MDYAVLEPSVISISDEEWDCEIQRDNFLEHFNLIIKNIDSNKGLVIAWSACADELIWGNPQRPPWKKDKSWSNTLIPIIFKFMQKNSDYIEIHDDFLECKITPPFNFIRDDLYNNFKILLAHLHFNCKGISIPLGLKNIPSKEYDFKVSDKALSPHPKLISCTKEFLEKINVEEEYWPSTINDDELLKEGILFLLKKITILNAV